MLIPVKEAAAFEVVVGAYFNGTY